MRTVLILCLAVALGACGDSPSPGPTGGGRKPWSQRATKKLSRLGYTRPDAPMATSVVNLALASARPGASARGHRLQGSRGEDGVLLATLLIDWADGERSGTLALLSRVGPDGHLDTRLRDGDSESDPSLALAAELARFWAAFTAQMGRATGAGMESWIPLALETLKGQGYGKARHETTRALGQGILSALHPELVHRSTEIEASLDGRDLVARIAVTWRRPGSSEDQRTVLRSRTTARGHEKTGVVADGSPAADAAAMRALHEFMDRYWAELQRIVEIQGTGGYAAEIETGRMLAVYAVVFTPDGQTVASGGTDGAVRMWHAEKVIAKGEPLWGHRGAINQRPEQIDGLACSEDGRLLASAARDNTVRIWNLDTSQPHCDPLRGHAKRVYAVAFHPDGDLLASASIDGTVRLWSVTADGAHAKGVIEDHGAGHRVQDVVFSPDGTLLTSIGTDGAIRFFDAKTGKPNRDPIRVEVDDPASQPGGTMSLAYSPDGALLASASHGGGVRVWKVATGEPHASLVTGETMSLDVTFSPDGETLFTGGSSGAIRRWRVSDGREIEPPLLGHKGPVFALDVGPNGRTLASAGWDFTVRFWDAKTGEARSHSEQTRRRTVLSATFSRDGTLLVSTYRNGDVILWDVSAKTVMANLRGHENAVHKGVFLPGGTMLATGGFDKTIRFWDLRTRRQAGKPLAGHDDVVPSIDVTPDGSLVASGSRDSTLGLWSVSDRSLVKRFANAHTACVRSVAFNHDGTRLAAGSKDKTVTIWDVAARRQIGEALTGHEHWVMQVAWVSELVASVSMDTTVRLWDPKTGEQAAPPQRGDDLSLWCIASQRDGRLFATADFDGTIRLWNIGDPGAPKLELVKLLRGHTDTPHGLGFSPDGKLLVSCGKDGRILLWSVPAGTLAGEFLEPEGVAGPARRPGSGGGRGDGSGGGRGMGGGAGGR